MKTLRLLALSLLLLTTCSDEDADGEDSGELLVLAASSLTDAFTELEATFEDANPDVDVVLTFDSSSTLAAQVAEGGPGDVLATADPSSMQRAAIDAEPSVFARNTGVIAVPADADAVIAPEDLEADGVTVAVCAPEVPCRIVADELFEQLGIDPLIATEEENVSAVVTKLEAGEVDAGVVYVTDDLASDEIEAIDIGGVAVTTDYPIAAITDSEASRAWIDFVLGDEGQEILGAHGFRS